MYAHHSRRDRDPPGELRSVRWALAALFGVLVIAGLVRSVGFEHAFRAAPDGSPLVLLAIDDAQYHARRARYTFERFPDVLTWDPYLNYPVGAFVPWPPLYDFGLGALPHLWSGGLQSFERVLVWASVVFGVFTALLVYFAGRAVGGPVVGATAGLFFAFLPATTIYSSVGNPDHHAAVSALATALLLGHLAALRTDASARARMWVELGLVVARVAMMWTWHGSILYLALGEGLARNPALFSYLSECPGAEVRIADGRIGLAQLPDRHFDVLVVDAFGSDSIPLHLITREALALYFEKLAGGGVLLLHISNSYLDLRPVLADLARDAGASARVQGYEPSGNGAEAAAGVALSSRWVAMSRSPGDLALLDERWLPLLANGTGRPWTDDFSNLLGALLWSATPPE